MAVMATSVKEKPITGEELLAMGDMGPCELIDGRIVAIHPSGFEHGTIEINLGSELRAFVRQRNLGRVTGGEVGIYIRRRPDGDVRGADIAFVSDDRQAKPVKGLPEVAPNLVVEIMSPEDRWQDVREKLADYFSIGVEHVGSSSRRTARCWSLVPLLMSKNAARQTPSAAKKSCLTSPSKWRNCSLSRYDQEDPISHLPPNPYVEALRQTATKELSAMSPSDDLLASTAHWTAAVRAQKARDRIACSMIPGPRP